MVVIRLTRVGKKKQAHYRIVVADSHRAVQGKFISILGWYNPHTKELQVKKDELKAWFDKGATPSNTLAKLLKSQKIELPKWVKIVEKKKAPKKVEESDSAKATPDKEPKDETTKKQEETSETPVEAEVKDTEEVAEEVDQKEVESNSAKATLDEEAAEEIEEKIEEETVKEDKEPKE